MSIKLWPMQEDAVKLASDQEGFWLTDDTGLGKTVTALAIVDEVADPYAVEFSCLIIARGPAHIHWRDHIERFGFPQEAFTLATWSDLRHQEIPPNLKRRWTFVIADESHNAQNRKSLQSKGLRKLKAEFRLALTATPASNGWAFEMWPQLNFLYPKKYTSFWRFHGTYQETMKHNKGSCLSCGNWHQREWTDIISNKNEEQLREELRPFTTGYRLKKECRCRMSAPPCNVCWGRVDDITPGMLGCMSSVCVGGIEIPHNHLADLPDKLPPVTYYVELSPKQRRAYNEMLSSALAWIGEREDEPLPAKVVVAQLTRLRQFASAYMQSDRVLSPWEIRDQETELSTEDEDIALTEEEIQGLLVKWHQTYKMIEPSPKLDLLMDLIKDTSGPIVVFTMFRQMVDLACTRFDKAGIEYINLPPQPGDQTVWQKFQEGYGKVFISTIQTGGESIELHRASTVIFLDRSWSPKDNKQAEDRLWRHGQENAVSIINIQAKDTVDQVIEDRLVFKAKNLRRLLGG